MGKKSLNNNYKYNKSSGNKNSFKDIKSYYKYFKKCCFKNIKLIWAVKWLAFGFFAGILLVSQIGIPIVLVTALIGAAIYLYNC